MRCPAMKAPVILPTKQPSASRLYRCERDRQCEYSGHHDDDFGSYTIVNMANILVASNSGRGQVYGVAGNGDVTELNSSIPL